MQALIFSAGLGTRMRGLTADRPKALVEVSGHPLIDHVLDNLHRAGVTDAVVNLHHFADKLEGHLRSRETAGLRLQFSDERDLLRDTGGGLLHAAHLFDPREPILLCNVDVLSDIDLRALVAAHRASGALATLAVQQRESSRQLLFDRELRLVGWTHLGQQAVRWAVPQEMERTMQRAFSGIQVISPLLPGLIRQQGVFSLIDVYLDLAASHLIQGYDHTGDRWFDVGSPEKLLEAEKGWITPTT
jgi:NDP-sugar pyrophosphorylase family protein